MVYLIMLLKSNLILSFCYLLHRFWLRKLPFYNHSRFYFLLSFAVASIIPFMVFRWHPIPAVATLSTNVSIDKVAKFLPNGQQIYGIDGASILLAVYIVGMLIMAAMFFLKLSSLLSVYFRRTAGVLDWYCFS